MSYQVSVQAIFAVKTPNKIVFVQPSDVIQWRSFQDSKVQLYIARENSEDVVLHEGSQKEVDALVNAILGSVSDVLDILKIPS